MSEYIFGAWLMLKIRFLAQIVLSMRIEFDILTAPLSQEDNDDNIGTIHAFFRKLPMVFFCLVIFNIFRMHLWLL